MARGSITPFFQRPKINPDHVKGFLSTTHYPSSCKDQQRYRSRPDFIDQCIWTIKSSYSVKSILSNRFATLFLLTHNRLMRCSFSVVNKVAVVALLLTWFLHHCWQRIFNKNTNYFSDVYILHSLSYAVWNFHLNWLTFLEAMTDVLGVHFLSGHSVLTKVEKVSKCISTVQVRS